MFELMRANARIVIGMFGGMGGTFSPLGHSAQPNGQTFGLDAARNLLCQTAGGAMA